MNRPAPGYSIASPIFLLVIAAIVVATAVTFAITFAGPPPRPAPVALRDAAAALRGAPLPATASADLIVSRGTAPAPRDGERPDPFRDARLRSMMGGGAVRGFYAEGLRGGGSDSLRGSFTVGWRDGGRWNVVRSAPDRLFRHWLTVTLVGMTAAMLLMAAVAWRIVRAIARPLRDLADGARSARPGTAPLPVGGPREVQALSAALEAMHDRLARHADNRTAMLAAIAHDLGTPLSRIAYWIEQLPDTARLRAVADIEEMRAMLGDVLRFARDERHAGHVTVDLGSVLDSLVDDVATAGAPASLQPGERALVRGDPAGLRRLFANLVDNAVRYGRCARLGWEVTPGEVTVRVDDDGPGFDPALGDRLFEPFARGDPSRNRATGGTGLGLAIVRSLTEAHGGRVTLGTSGQGGRVTVVLPRA